MNASVDDVKEFVAESKEAALAMAESHFRASVDQLEIWVVPPSVHISGLGERVLLLAAPHSERSGRPPEARREERRPERDRERPSGRDRDRDRDRGGRDRDRGAPRSESPRQDFRSEPRPESRSERPARVTPPVEREERDTRSEERRPSPESESPRTAKAALGQVGIFIAGVLERMKLRDVTVSESETDDGEIIVTLDGRAITSLAEREPRLLAALSHLGHRAAEALIDDDAAAQVEIRGARRAPREEPRERGGRDSRRESRRDGGRGDRPSRPRDPEDRDIDEVELERLAKDAARSVRESGEAELLPPMNSRERWFVHNALKEERGVRSESEGEGARKRVKILPA